jgi:uracil-DNA glycosylase family 4
VIRPGGGFPTDKASARTPVAHDAEEVRRLAGSAPSLDHLDGRSSVCRACPRLVDWREQVAQDKRAAFAEQTYWGRPVAGWGVPRPRLVIVGLAPAAHGANRTGRVFTGDRSGDVLFAALHRAGLAAAPHSTDAYDGQVLIDTRITMPVRCAPPGNAPSATERDACAPWLAKELTWLLPSTRVLLALGSFAWKSALRGVREAGGQVPTPAPAFAHGREVALPGGPTLLGSFHVSQQNTFTGRLTPQMLDEVLGRAVALMGDPTRG